MGIAITNLRKETSETPGKTVEILKTSPQLNLNTVKIKAKFYLLETPKTVQEPVFIETASEDAEQVIDHYEEKTVYNYYTYEEVFSFSLDLSTAEIASKLNKLRQTYEAKLKAIETLI